MDESQEVPVSEHNFLYFGSFKFESLEWEKRSVFNRNKIQEEMEDLKSLGLVSRKKAYFEQYYKRKRALKAMEETQQSELTVEVETEIAIESLEGGISNIIDHSEEALLGHVLEKRNTDEGLQVQSIDLESASSTLQMSTEVQSDSESILLESLIRTEETENNDNMNLDDTAMTSKPNNSELHAKQEKDCSDDDVHAHQTNKLVEQTQVSCPDAQDISKKNCTLKSNVRLHLATAGTVLHQTNSDAVISDCNIVQRKSNLNVREYKDRIPVSRVKVPVASAKNGLKEENKGQTNTSVPSKYQFQQQIGQRKNSVGSSKTISDKVLRNCRPISVASHKPLISARSKSTVPCPISFGPERLTRNNAPSLQNASKDAARTCSVNNRESEKKRGSEQVREKVLTTGPMRGAAKLLEPHQDQKRKRTEIKRISLPINLTVPNHCKTHGGGEYRSTIALRKNEPKEGPVASVRVGVKVNQKSKTKTSQAQSCKYQQILSMMKSKREEELQKLKSVGLVTQKRALFEEYYKRRRALKAMKEITQSELTQQYGGDDPMTSQNGLDETSVRTESLGDEMSNVFTARSVPALLESFPRTKEFENHDNVDFDKKDISRKSDNSESDTKQEKNSLSCEVRNHHRERLPRYHTKLIRAERHQLSGLVDSSKKNCKLKSKIGSDITTTGNVLHPANSHAVKSVRDNLLEKANSHVRRLKENIPVKKEEETVASVRKRIIYIPGDSYKPLRVGLFQGTSRKAASVKKQGTEIKRGSHQEQERVSATRRMRRVANVSEQLKARTLRPFNLCAINQSNPHGGCENRSTVALRKVELKEVASSQTDKRRRPLSGGMSYHSRK